MGIEAVAFWRPVRRQGIRRDAKGSGDTPGVPKTAGFDSGLGLGHLSLQKARVQQQTK